MVEDRTKVRKNNLQTRILVGVPAAALFLLLLWLGALPLLLFTYVLVTLGFYELLCMRKISIWSFPSMLTLGLLWYLLLPAAWTVKASVTNTEIIYFVVSVLLAYTVTTKNKFNFEDCAYLIMSLLYVGTSFYYLNMVRDKIGFINSLFLVLLIWASDSGAYFVGRKLGKHKLWESISPNKTIEGLLGGICFALGIAFIFYLSNVSEYTLIRYLFLAVVVTLIGTIGDLVQSAYKRHFGVKDASSLLPGHGGVLDRFDSLMYTLPLVVILRLLPL